MSRMKIKGITPRGKRSCRIDYTNAEGQQQFETIRGTTAEEAFAEAQRVLAIRLGEIAQGIPTSSKPHTVSFAELCADVVNYYERAELDTKADIDARYRLHLLPFFGLSRRAADLTTADFDRYTNHRRRQNAATNTIKRELEAARRAFLLAKDATPPKVHIVPKIAMLGRGTVRKGFFKPEQLEAICRHLPPHLIPPARFAYITGWRHGEVLGILTLGHVHLDGVGEVRLEPGEAKNEEGRSFPMTQELRALLNSIWPKKPSFPTTPLFRNAQGKRITGFYKSWTTACRKAGLPVRWVPKHRAIPLRNADGTLQCDEKGRTLFKRDAKGQLILEPVLYQHGPKKGEPILVCRAAVHFHDFRRTAYRNLVRLGTPDAVAQAAVGWLDPKTAARYDIVAQADLDVLRERLDAAGQNAKIGRFYANSGDPSD